MKINRENYEAYFIDYLEGTLDEKLVDDFLEFLQKNPDLKEELSLFQSVSLEPEEIQFDKKEQLLKQKYDLEDHFNQSSVALLEGDLSDDEKSNFEKYLNSHPNKKKEFQIFQKTKLQPDLSIRFNKKNNLYHHTIGKTIIMWSYRVAVVLVLALTFYVLGNRYSTQNAEETKLAVIEKEKPEKETAPQNIPANNVQPEEQKQNVKPVEEVEQKEEINEINPVEPMLSKPAQKESKRIQENNTGRMNETEIVGERVRIEPLETIASLSASINIVQPKATLKNVEITIYEEPEIQGEDKFLAEIVKEKTGIDKLSLKALAKTGLNIVSSISKDKLSYETNESGKVTEINYDSRLLAFSIPTKNDTGE